MNINFSVRISHGHSSVPELFRSDFTYVFGGTVNINFSVRISHGHS